MDRAERRHHTERMKARFREKQKAYAYWGNGPKPAGMYANHGKTCSCFMCGNPRRYLGEVTRAEKRVALAMADIE